MLTKRFRCLNCGNRFEVEVVEKDEAEARRLLVKPVHCPKCNRTDVEKE